MTNAQTLPKMTLAEFNADVARQVKDLHDRMHAAGHPVTVTEAKALFCLGYAALAKMVDHEEGAAMMMRHAEKFAAQAERETA